MCVCVCVWIEKERVWFDLFSLLNGISIFIGYLMPKPS